MSGAMSMDTSADWQPQGRSVGRAKPAYAQAN
jgi:hypothetical protein